MAAAAAGPAAAARCAFFLLFGVIGISPHPPLSLVREPCLKPFFSWQVVRELLRCPHRAGPPGGVRGETACAPGQAAASGSSRSCLRGSGPLLLVRGSPDVDSPAPPFSSPRRPGYFGSFVGSLSHPWSLYASLELLSVTFFCLRDPASWASRDFFFFFNGIL